MSGGRRVRIEKMSDDHVVNTVLVLEAADDFREFRFPQYVALIAEVEKRSLQVELEVARVRRVAFDDVAGGRDGGVDG